MSCPFCGCFTSPVRGQPGYEPDPDDFARAEKAAQVLRELAQMPLRATGKDYDRLVKAARTCLPEYGAA